MTQKRDYATISEFAESKGFSGEDCSAIAFELPSRWDPSQSLGKALNSFLRGYADVYLSKEGQALAKAIVGHMTPAELKQVRQSLGLTQPEMSAALGLSVNYVNAMERQAKPISRQTALLVEAYRSGWRPHDWPATTG